MIMNILIPDSGKIKVFGNALNQSGGDQIGYMPEERGLYKRMNVRDVLHFFGGLKSSNQLHKRIEEWLEKLDLLSWADKKVETLSKGMSQKVQFIATVISQPQLVILDEPFTGLDPVNTEVIKDAILDLQRDGTTIIFSTHDMNMAEKMCDFIFMIFNGKKVLDGTLESIQAAYANDTIRIRCGNGFGMFDQIEGVEAINDYGQYQELRISENADAQNIIRQILQRTPVSGFDVVKPSLHDIFVRIARPPARGSADE